MAAELTELQRRVLEVIEIRKSDNPVTGKDIANVVGLKKRATGVDGADLRSIVNALRVKGYPVCASGKGYFWPRDRVELEAFTDSFQGRINDQQEACDGMKKGALMLTPGRKLRPSQETKIEMWEDPETRLVYKVAVGSIDKFLAEHPNGRKVGV